MDFYSYLRKTPIRVVCFGFFFSGFLEQRLSGALVLFHPLIKCCAATGQSEAETLKGSLDKRGEKLRGKGCIRPFLRFFVPSHNIRSKLWSYSTCQKHQGFKKANAKKYFYGEKLTQQNLFVSLPLLCIIKSALRNKMEQPSRSVKYSPSELQQRASGFKAMFLKLLLQPKIPSTCVPQHTRKKRCFCGRYPGSIFKEKTLL